METALDTIYFDKRGDDGNHFPDTWAYYRMTSVAGLGNPEGMEGITRQACRLTWPALEDVLAQTDTVGVVGFDTAYDTVNNLLRKQWCIERERSIFIGVRSV